MISSFRANLPNFVLLPTASAVVGRTASVSMNITQHWVHVAIVIPQLLRLLRPGRGLGFCRAASRVCKWFLSRLGQVVFLGGHFVLRALFDMFSIFSTIIAVFAVLARASPITIRSSLKCDLEG